MHVLSEWEPLVPSSLAVVDEDAEVLFEPLICAFGLAVSLGVVGGAYVLLDIEDAAEFLREMRGEAGIAVGDNLARGAVVWEHMLDVKLGDGGGCGGFMARDKNSRFRAVVVRDGEDAVKAVGEGELNDKVHSDGFEWEGGAVSGDGAVRDTGARGVSFGGLTGGASSDEGGDKVFHVGPPVVFGDKKAGFKDTRVTCGGGIVV